MDLEERFELVKRSTVEVLTDEDLRTVLKEKSNPVVYIGRATTGSVHLGHIIPLGKLLDFQRAGVTVKILIADIHAALDDQKAKWEDLNIRSEYTKKCIELAFDWKTTPIFSKGSEFQLSRGYVNDVLKMSTLSTVDRAMRAASEVTRMKNPKVSELIYPIMQALDEEYLGADMQLGGTDQRHIFAFAREYLPSLGYRKRVEVMTPLISSLQGPGKKMSSSVAESAIKIYESEDSLRKKISNAYCPAGIVKDNLILQICEFIVFPSDGKFAVEREPKFGGDTIFGSYKDLESAFVEKKLHPVDLKNSLSKYLIKRFKRAREYFEKHIDLLEALGKDFLP